MGWYYDFYRVYRTKQEDIDAWQGKSVQELPSHLQFFSQESKYDYEKSELEEIVRFLLPITMIEDWDGDSAKECRGYLATLQPLVLLTSSAYEVEYRVPRSGWYHFVKLTNRNAKKMLKIACVEKEKFERLVGNKKIRNVVYIMHQ